VPSDRERGGLVGVKKPLVEAAPVTDAAAERTILPPEVTDPQSPAVRAAPPPAAAEPTKPATFHLPVPLLQRLRATCRLKNTTMVDFVRQAIEDRLERQRPTEEEIRKLLGM
jgi:hypothetical protein